MENQKTENQKTNIAENSGANTAKAGNAQQRSNHPEKKFRAGTICATVWKNAAKRKDGSEGAFRTISLERSYKDKNNAWQTTNSFRINDLPRAELVLHQAYEFSVQAGHEASEEDVLF